MYKDSLWEKIWYSNFMYTIRKIYPPNIFNKTLRNAYNLDNTRGIRQRLKFGVSISDAWSFDNYLAKVITQGIKFVRDDTHSGTPCRIYNENNRIIYESNLEYTPNDNSIHDKAIETWQSILNQIIEGFEKYDMMVERFEWLENKKDIRECSDEEIEKLEEKFDIAFKLLHNNFSSFWT